MIFSENRFPFFAIMLQYAIRANAAATGAQRL